MRVHIVQKGDTLWKIAKQYAIGFEELKRLNAHLANPDYIVPGMEIYLPATAGKKEVVKPVVKEQPKPVKEMPMPTKETPVPVPTPLPAPAQPVQKPLWQGNLYFQQPMPTPQPVPMPMPMPNWQTHVHVQPTMEQHMTAPPPQMMPMQPQLQPQPIYIQQPQQQPIFIEQPMMPQMQMPMPMPMPIPQMMPVQPCPHCHKMPVEEPMHHMQPAMQEESPGKDMMCSDHDQQVRQYYEEIQQIMCMPQPCCHPHMMPYNPYPMSHMMPHNQRSWHM